MKGKKFSAAEKHFQDKEIALRQEMRFFKEWSEEIANVNNQLMKENKQLKKENEEIKVKYAKLLEYSKLSENDIITALQKDKSMVQMNELMNMTSRLRF